ncbi:MAG: EpsG family protein, partial [Lachnospiraceae bacterium]|nr:EpsG family protein [Lachnospiraceae bacterium]
MASVVLYILIAAFAVIPAYFLSDTRDSHTCAAGRAALLRLPESLRCAQVTIFRNKALMAAIFMILAVPAVLRQNVGNDYMRYVAFFHLANIDAYVPTEPGFNLLVKLIYGLCGYENSLLVFAVFSVLTITFFLIAIRALSGRFFLSFFLFMAFGYYFQTYNTVRYYFAMSIVLCAMIFFLRK